MKDRPPKSLPEKNDTLSNERMRGLISDLSRSPSNPLRLLVQRLTNKLSREGEAQEHWRQIILHKEDLEARLGRAVSIYTALIDYFEVIGDGARQQKTPDPRILDTGPVPGDLNLEESIARIYSPNYHLESLKRELLRAKRYKHALSAIMLDVDDFCKINETGSPKSGGEILAVIVNIIQKIIRAVDILTRYSGERFLIILPNTNKREAQELSERLRQNIFDRTRRIQGLDAGITVTLSVGQTAGNVSSTEFIKQLENVLEAGKTRKTNAVYFLH